MKIEENKSIEEKISIIMPVYNAATYLPEAIDCVLNQTLKEFELICINDCSTDESLEILNSYKERDDRISIYTNENRCGAAFSRNIGINIASGQYVIFLDSDDVFDFEMLELLYNKCKQFELDILFFDYVHVSSSHIYDKKILNHSSTYESKFCDFPFCAKDLFAYEYEFFPKATCSRIYKHSFITENGLEFQNIQSSNDVYFSAMSFLLANKVMVLNVGRPLLYARDYESVNRISSNRNPMCAYEAIQQIKKDITYRNLWDELKDYFYAMAFNICLATVRRFKDEDKGRIFYDHICRNFENDFINVSELNTYYINILDKINNEKFDSYWYNSELIIKWCLYLNSQIIESIIEDYRTEDYDIVIWGTGNNGYILLEFLKNKGISIDYVVDKSELKCGNELLGYIINSPNNIPKNERLLIITTPDNSYDFVNKEFEYEGVKKVLDLKGIYGIF